MASWPTPSCPSSTLRSEDEEVGQGVVVNEQLQACELLGMGEKVRSTRHVSYDG